MSVTYVSQKNNRSKESPVNNSNYTPDQYVPYVRPSDWLTLPSMTGSSQAFYGLVAVCNDNSNFISIQATTSAGNVSVDWGDGTVDVVASNSVVNHVYDYASISSSTLSTRGYKQAIVSVTPVSGNLTSISTQVKYAGTAAPNSGYTGTARWLDIKFGSPNLTSFTISNNSPTVWQGMLEQIEIVSLSSSSTWNLLNAFRFLVKLQNFIWPSAIPLSGANSAFASCQSLINAPEFPAGISGTSIDTASMFNLCYSLKYVPNYSISGASGGTVASMFTNCTSLVKAPKFTNTSKITNWSSMFNGCNQLIDVPTYDTSGATTLANMFQNCRTLVTAPYLNTVNVTSFNSMFTGCVALQNVPAYNMASATDVNLMFQSCGALKSTPSFIMPKMVTLGGMFSACQGLVDIGPLITTGNLTTIDSTFGTCASLKTAPIISNTINVTSVISMFNTCRSLIDVPVYDTSNTTNMANMFLNCSSLTTAPNISTTKVSNMDNMFSGCTSLDTVPNYDTANVTSMASLFNGCSALVTSPTLNLVKCTTVQSMFSGCYALQDVSGISNTGNVTVSAGMFNSATNLLKAPDTDFSKVTNFNSMFVSCYGLNSIPAYNMANAASASSFATSCYELGNVLVTNCVVTTSFASSKLSKDNLETVFTNLGGPASTQTITISGTPGADTAISRSCTFNTNQVTLANTGIQAAGVTSGMFATGTGVTTALSVTTTASNDRITSAVVTFPTSCIGGRVSFTTTANGLTRYVIYYIVTASSNYIQVSTTPGGSVVDITADGTMTMNMENQVVGVSTNAVTLAFPTSSTTTATIAFRKLNTNIARLKNWTVSG